MASPPALDDTVLLRLLRGLGNPHRLRVFRALLAQPLRGKEVSAACAVTPQEASRHLARLQALGLARPEGRLVAPSPLGRRVALHFDELRAAAEAGERLAGLDPAAVPLHLPLRPLLEAGPRPDPAGEVVRRAEHDALEARRLVLRVAAQPWSPWPVGHRGPERYEALAAAGPLGGAEAFARGLPPASRGGLRLVPVAPLWLLATERAATLVLPRAAGGLAWDKPFRSASGEWVAWCEALFEHLAAQAAEGQQQQALASPPPPAR